MPYRRLGERWQGLGQAVGVAGQGAGIVNLLTNGDFELPGIPAAPTAWTAQSSAILTTVADPRDGSSGVAAMDVECGAAAAGIAYQDLTGKISNGQELTVMVWAKRIDTNPLVRIVDTSGVIASVSHSNTSWEMITAVATIVNDTTVIVRLQASNAVSGISCRFDDGIAYISG